ncbi:MAG: VanZ family protein [Planctomycetales bacterium]
MLARWGSLAGYVLILALIVCAADSGWWREVFDTVRSIPAGDKACHFLLMGMLVYLANRALQGRRFAWKRGVLFVGTVVVSVAVLAEEVSQIWIPGRSFSLLDLAADVLGMLAGDWWSRRAAGMVHRDAKAASATQGTGADA